MKLNTNPNEVCVDGAIVIIAFLASCGGSYLAYQLQSIILALLSGILAGLMVGCLVDLARVRQISKEDGEEYHDFSAPNMDFSRANSSADDREDS